MTMKLTIDQDQEDDQADDEVAAHDELRKAADDIAGRVGALVAMRQDHARRRDVERQAQHRGDQQDGREGREIERPLDPQRHHQDQHRERDREGQADVDHEGRDRQEQHRQDDDDAEGEADVAAVARLSASGRLQRGPMAKTVYAHGLTDDARR